MTTGAIVLTPTGQAIVDAATSRAIVFCCAFLPDAALVTLIERGGILSKVAVGQYLFQTAPIINLQVIPIPVVPLGGFFATPATGYWYRIIGQVLPPGSLSIEIYDPANVLTDGPFLGAIVFGFCALNPDS